MKIFKDIILGIIIGTVAFTAVTYSNRYFIVASATPLTSAGVFSDLLTSVGVGELDYDDVMVSATYKNLYLMMFGKTIVEPEDTALRELSQSYGLTLAEAAAVKNGAVAPLLHSSRLSSNNITNQDVLNIAAQAQQEFKDMYEIASLQQSLALTSANSEIFSNGNVLDSGFDLVYDLTMIEELLFSESAPTTVGGPITFGKKTSPSPNAPLYAPLDEGIKPDGSVAYESIALSEAGAGAGQDSTGDSGGTADTPSGSAPAEHLKDLWNPPVLEKDVCPTTTSVLDTALNDYKTAAEEYYAENGGGGTDGTEAAENGTGDGVDGSGGGAAQTQQDGSFLSKLTASPSKWDNPSKCNGYLIVEGDPEATSSGGYSATANYYVCVEFAVQWASYSSSVPVDNCINCEVEKILAYLKKTLAGSLYPNKATGNFAESAKCKNTFADVPLVDIKFIQMWSPAQLPPKDDAIFGKSAIDSWEKFIKRTRPLALPSLSNTFLADYNKDLAAEWTKKNAASDDDLSAVINQIAAIEDTITRQQANNVENFSIVSKGEDFVTYSQDILAEVKHMTMYFKNYANMFKQISEESCPLLLNKKYLD